MTDDLYTSGTYLENNPTWHTEDSPWKAKYILALLKKHGVTPKRVGEVGAGAGGILFSLAERMPESVFVGYEISPQAVAMNTKFVHERIAMRQTDLLATSDQFDVLLCIDVIEHVEDYKSFLIGLRSKADAFVFHIPLDWSVVNIVRPGKFARLKKEIGHIHYFNKKTALMALRESGYEVVDFVYTAATVDLPARSLAARLARWPRAIGLKLAPDFTARVLGGCSLLVLCKR